MDAATIKALKGSIRKWDGIAKGTGVSKGPDNCPLCELFYAKTCKGCPVAAMTKEAFCVGTPYEAFEDMPIDQVHIDWEGGSRAVGDVGKIIAKAEANFLRALLPRRN